MKKSMVVCGVLCAILLGCEKEAEKTTVEPTIQEEPIVQETPKVEQPVVEAEPITDEEVVIEEPVVEEEVVAEETNRGGLGDTITVQTSDGDYEIIFTDAYYTDDRNQFSDTVVDKVLIVVYEYKNLTYNDGWSDGLWITEGVHYTIYDGDGYSLETYPAETPYFQDEVTEGRSSRGSEAFAVVGDQTHYEIEVAGCIIEFDLQ